MEFMLSGKQFGMSGQPSKHLSGAHVQVVHCEGANGELFNASFQDSTVRLPLASHANAVYANPRLQSSCILSSEAEVLI